MRTGNGYINLLGEIMDTQQLLIGNIAIASLIIKTIVSTIKLTFPTLVEKQTTIRLITLACGVLSAFVVDAQLIAMPEAAGWIQVVQKVIAGIFISATAMGVHETTKLKKG